MSDGTSPLLVGRWDDASLTHALLQPTRERPRVLTLLLLVSAAGTLMLFAAVAWTAAAGIGVWGNNVPVGWGFAIINFVWWIGIGHAGTFISAVLLLFEQPWRNSLNRIAEAMTLFAVIQAGLFPLLHLGRPWFGYWLLPYPSALEIWPQFMSVLTWDAGAVTTYFVVSVLFWYLGLLPDLASARDTATSRRRRRAYGLFALGWRGSTRHWRHLRRAQLLLAGLATPLVLSVHSIVSMDFATAKLSGWHSTIFPPYFVAGAIFSGFAMVLTLVVPLRRLFGWERFITPRHLDRVAKMTLAMGLLVAYSYAAEHFVAWYSGVGAERRVFFDTRPFGPYGWLYWVQMGCNVGAVQLLWFRAVRQRPWALFALSIIFNVGMWLERFVLIVTSQHRDFLPSSWDLYVPSLVDGALFLGSLSFFALLMLLFLRVVPPVAIAETKALLHERGRDA